MGTKVRKSLEELTLLDRFLFDEAMEDPENMKILLDIILNENIVLKHLPQTEKEFRVSNLAKSTRIDVWAIDKNDSVYDTEVQKKDTGNLPKRSRYYQSMMDTKMLKLGETDYNKLGKIFIILIMPFDLFGQGKYMYTFTNMCEEVPGLRLEDGATRIFLNTRGKNDDEVSKELVQLLHYMEYTNSVDSVGLDERLQRLMSNVKSLQQNAEVSVKYMQLWEEMAYEREEARAEGHAEALTKFAALTKILLDSGKLEELKCATEDAEYRDKLFAEYNL